MKSAAIISKPSKPELAAILPDLLAWFGERGYKLYVDEQTAEYIDAEEVVVRKNMGDKHPDFALVLGGDGTLLSAARAVAREGVPIMAVNLGSLGFLTEVPLNEMYATLEAVDAGTCPSEQRAVIDCTVFRDDEAIARHFALNDVVVNKWETGRTMDFETSINGRFVNSHSGDGMVIATATGSTAYAMSCGGPIVEPDLDLWVLAPICPHTLSDRPIVVRAGSSIQLRMGERLGSQAQVTCDGSLIGELSQGDTLLVGGADAQITLLHPPGYDFYRLLRSKLHWGQGGHGNGE